MIGRYSKFVFHIQNELENIPLRVYILVHPYSISLA